MSRFNFIAICGHPTAGKTEVQNLLSRNYAVIPVDDGECLRDFGKRHLGLTQHQVTHPDGKAEPIVFCGEEMLVRQFLGRLGNALELEFGEHVMPEIAMNSVAGQQALNSNAFIYSFGSVRKTQGWAYKKGGRGVVLEVRRPGIGPSGNDFDEFDPTAVDLVVNNNGSLNDLASTVARVWDAIHDGYVGREPVPYAAL